MNIKKLTNSVSIWIISFGLLTTVTTSYSNENDFEVGDDVASTVTAIIEQLAEQNFITISVLDHAANARSVGLDLRPTQVIFARPNQIEPLILRHSRTIGIDLPWRILVYENEAGKVKVFSSSIGYAMDRHGIKPLQWELAEIQQSLMPFTHFEAGLETIASSMNFDNTVASLLDAIPLSFNIPFIIDYNFAPSNNRPFINVSFRNRNPLLIVFGNPNVGTPLMQANQKIGVDLPQKFLVWQDLDRTVNITYNNPHVLARRFNITGQDARLNTIAGALRKFALMGAGETP